MGYVHMLKESSMITAFFIISVLMSCVVVFGLVANALLIYSVLRQPNLRRSPTYVTLVSLAASDFLAMISASALIASAYAPDMDPRLCLFFMSSGYSMLCSSAYHIMAFSVLRYTLLVKPLFAMKHLTVKTVASICGAIWTVAIIFGGASMNQVGLTTFNVSNTSVLICTYKSSALPLFISTLVVVAIIPLAVIIAFHVAKVYHLRRRSALPEGAQAAQVSTKVVAGILVTFAVTSLPNAVYLTVLLLLPEISVETVVIGYGFAGLFIVNNALDPLLYFFLSERARSSIQCCRLICCHQEKQRCQNVEIGSLTDIRISDTCRAANVLEIR